MKSGNASNNPAPAFSFASRPQGLRHAGACLLALVMAMHGSAKDIVVEKGEAPSLKAAADAKVTAGGATIVVPSPAKDMAEVTEDLDREAVKVFVPSSNRLLTSFVLSSELPISKMRGKVLSRYALVEIPLKAESMDCKPDDFKLVTDELKKGFGDTIAATTKEVQEEFDHRLKQLHVDNLKMSFEKPVEIGVLFSKEDAYGFGLMSLTSVAGTSVKIAVACTFVRAKERLIFCYLYAKYKDDDTIKALRKTSEQWADAILLANKER